MKYRLNLLVLFFIVSIASGCWFEDDDDDDEAIISEDVITWSAVSAGGYHTLAVKSDGTLWAWGWNEKGQLGINSRTDTDTPAQVESNWVYASAGFAHSIGIKDNRTLWGWGFNMFGQVGDGLSDKQPIVPLLIGTTTDWILVSAGGYHSLAIRVDGSLWAWGQNLRGQLGDPTFDEDEDFRSTRPIPIESDSDADWAYADAGEHHSIALKTDHTLWAWGGNDCGQLGDGSVIDSRAPSRIGNDSDWSKVSAGGYYTLALKNDGTLWAWGANNYGQLGNGTNADETENRVPHQVGDSNDWTAISAGFDHALALKSDGTLWAWGRNDYGQLGDGSKDHRYAPVQIGTDSDWKEISAGMNFSVAVKSEGSLWSWGANDKGQLGNGDDTGASSNIPILIGE